ncbi:MAG: hypothetical protein SVM79_06155, partial [Chloroflexota bacterium]|nr:hypothetical protein [Chloroflexota bacterium]
GIKAGEVSALDSEITKKEEQSFALNAKIEQLESEFETEINDLNSALEDKIAAFDVLSDKYDSASQELQSVKASYNSLNVASQTLRNDYDDLLSACTNATVDEILRLMDEVDTIESDYAWCDIRRQQLEKQLTPSSEHALPSEQIWNNPEYKSPAWEGRDYELHQTLVDLGKSFREAHLYLEGEYDCNDMAVNLWNMLLRKNITSLIVIGNREKVGETFNECTHAWLYVFDAQGKIIYLEPTTGDVLYGLLPNGSKNLAVVPYRDGFIYEKPSDLWKDLKKWW